MKGRKPVPTRLKLLQGTYRPDRARMLNEARPEPKVGPCPSYFSADAKKEWRRIVPRLERNGLATELDYMLLEIHCDAWATYREATQDLKRRGPVLRLPNGLEQRNPYLKIQRDAQQTMLQIASHFGMSPSSRARVHAIPLAQASPLRVFVNQHLTDPQDKKRNGGSDDEQA